MQKEQANCQRRISMERGIITISENGAVTMPTVPVWMTRQEMSDAFNVFGCDIRRAIRIIYKNMELLESDTMRYIRKDNMTRYDVYSIEMVIAVAFKLRTKECMVFIRSSGFVRRTKIVIVRHNRGNGG